MKNTLLFYDIETTGLNKAFDQILQFAAIRVDSKFNEIERHNIGIRLRPDVVPSPEALITHMITGGKESDMCEFEASCLIHRIMNTPGTISLGYNTMGFDDEFLRFFFYRNLLPPYTHQYAAGCSRMDVFPAAIFYFYYKNEVINWPLIDGKPTLRLEEINRVNSFSAGVSHDALADVEATLGLARKLSCTGEVYSYITGFFSKNTDSSRIEKLPVAFDSQFGQHRIGVMVSGEFGHSGSHHCPVLFLGNSVPYKNQTLWLRLDMPEIMTSNSENVHEKTRVSRKRLGEPGFILPPDKRFIKNISGERMKTANENLAWLKENQGIFNEIVKYHADFRYPDVPDVDADAALYTNGFFSRQTDELSRKFHLSSITGRLDMLDSFSEKIPATLAKRIMFRNFPESMTVSKIKKEYDDCVEALVSGEGARRVPVDHRGTLKLTSAASLAAIDNLLEGRTERQLDDTKRALLLDLREYLCAENFKLQDERITRP